MASAPALCARCQRFDIQAFGKAVNGTCCAPFVDISEATQSGCMFCILIAKKVGSVSRRKRSWMDIIVPPGIDLSPLRGGREVLGQDSSTSSGWPLQIRRLDVYAQNWGAVSGRGKRLFFLRVAADDGTPADISKDVTGTLLTRSLSLADMQAVKAWYETCWEQHEACRLSLSGSDSIDPREARLPARLVKVEYLSGEGKVSLSLCETEGALGSYVAISHRWDAFTQQTQTTNANYACRVRRCGHQSSSENSTCALDTTIPALYQDAGMIAHHLGISYLWIDSLCIIQDDDDDWKRESVRMTDYYQRAWLTIVATTTSDDGRLLGTELEASQVPTIVQLPYRDSNGQQKGHFYVQASSDSELEDDYNRFVRDCELQGRGWVFQEIMLSRQTLTFSRTEVYMTCQTKAPVNLHGDSVESLSTFRIAGSVHDILRTWEQSMTRYSRLSFTQFEKDHFVALAGVAKEFKRALESASGHYVQLSFGHLFVWVSAEGAKGFLRGLLWQQSDSQRDGQQLQHQRVRLSDVPTWSWASVAIRSEENLTGLKVEWYRGAVSDNQALCSANGLLSLNSLDATQPPLTTDPESEFGDQTYRQFPVIKIRGRLHQVRIHGFFPTDAMRTTAARLTYRKPQEAPATNLWRQVTLVGPEPEYTIGWASVEHPDYQENNQTEAFPATVYALFVLSLPGMRGGLGWGNLSGRQTAFEVLLLRPAKSQTDLGPGSHCCYERVGMGRLCGNEAEACFKAAQDTDIFLV